MGDKGRNPYRKIHTVREAEAEAKRQKALADVAEPNPYELALLAVEHNPRIPEINLHGKRAPDARRELEIFLYEQSPKEYSRLQPTRVIRIIHGKGSGVLQAVVNEMLTEKKRQGLIAYFRPGTSTRDAGAVIYAMFAE